MRDDRTLFAVVINGSGVDSQEVDYVIHHGHLEDAVKAGRGPDINKVWTELAERLGVLMHAYGIRKTT